MGVNSYRELIEIEANPSGGVKLTVSGNHAVSLLTHLKDKGLNASGQSAPLFGTGDFPTIYYINFSLDFEKIHAAVKDYLRSLSLNHTEIQETKNNSRMLRLDVGS